MKQGSIKLGDKVRDPITGFEGIAVSRSTFLHGCDRIGLQAPMDKDGKVPEWQYFDELQLMSAPADKKKGGPRPEPKRNPDGGGRR